MSVLRNYTRGASQSGNSFLRTSRLRESQASNMSSLEAQLQYTKCYVSIDKVPISR